jgi:hypothetical protein
VEKEKSREPPSALKPYATAIASRIVDLPVPFSPTRNVTGFVKLSCSMEFRNRTTGKEDRYDDSGGISLSRIPVR